MSEIEKIAKQMVAKGKGILAADESTGTMTKRLSSVNVESTSENRLKFRETLFSAENISFFEVKLGHPIFLVVLKTSLKDEEFTLYRHTFLIPFLVIKTKISSSFTYWTDE